jgi:hypothetical protein
MVDIDDVLMPWADAVHEACRDAGLHDLETYSSWSQWEDYGCTKDEWLYVVSTLTKAGGLYHTPPIPGAVEAIRRLYWAGHQIHIVTARGFMAHSEQIRAWTDEWLEEWAVPHHTRTFAQSKVTPMRILPCGSTTPSTTGSTTTQDLDAAGVRVYLLSRPHNLSFPADRRVETVDQFVDIILEEQRA